LIAQARRRSGMFEARWMSCDDPEMMLRYMLGKTGDRKFRLFACACVRRIWLLLRDERSRAAVHMAEQYADRPSGHALLLRSRSEARLAEQLFDRLSRREEASDYDSARWAARAAEATVEDTGWDVARNAAWSAAHALNVAATKERRAQCALLRDFFGNPFCPQAFHPAWLRWHDGCVIKMAQSIYQERRFQELPILADALEEAGCVNEMILWHCREPGEHARGCWVLDAVLGKN
jgi:hypothetical protein